ncbi:single-stranded DNA-binding protein [Candidatus Peribacteria bacterium]|nr:MAG: single-stranded DNA-binding protein [Candidatus Peribacteria bacterium]
MKSVNKVILLGNVTRDPELKATANGQSVATFGLATNRVWKDHTGEKQSLAEYHNLVAWGGLADFCAQNIRKGKPLYIEGYLKTRSWDGPEASKIFRTEIVVENLVLLGPRDGMENGMHQDSPVMDMHQEHPVEAMPSAPQTIMEGDIQPM